MSLQDREQFSDIVIQATNFLNEICRSIQSATNQAVFFGQNYLLASTDVSLRVRAEVFLLSSFSFVFQRI